MTRTPTPHADIRERASLPIDAKAVLGALFIANDVVFQLVESRPAPRMQAALDELEKAGAVVKEALPTRADGSHGVRYKACWPSSDYRRFASKAQFPIVEPIP